MTLPFPSHSLSSPSIDYLNYPTTFHYLKFTCKHLRTEINSEWIEMYWRWIQNRRRGGKGWIEVVGKGKRRWDERKTCNSVHSRLRFRFTSEDVKYLLSNPPSIHPTKLLMYYSNHSTIRVQSVSIVRTRVDCNYNALRNSPPGRHLSLSLSIDKSPLFLYLSRFLSSYWQMVHFIHISSAIFHLFPFLSNILLI